MTSVLHGHHRLYPATLGCTGQVQPDTFFRDFSSLIDD